MTYQNPILNTDAYKLTHWKEYPEGLTKLYSYGEARKGGVFDQTIFFGLQMVIHDHFLEPITDEMIDEAEKVAELTFGTKEYFNRPVWEKVRDLGYWPVKITTIPEGTLVPTGTVLFTLESTEPWFATTLNALETMLMHVWYPTTIATNDFFIKKDLLPFFKNTGNIANLPWAVNDFGLRGVTSLQAGERGGAAHLVNFQGTDNMAADLAIERIYDYSGRGQSVWATEHSVATSYGPEQGEFEYLNAQLDRSDENTAISIVIDSYDTFAFIKDVVGSDEIKSKIIARPGRVVFRPDSGNPIDTPLQVIEELGKIFGYKENEKGYKVLNSNVGVIQGDGMKRESIKELYQKLTDLGWSADNIVVGSGGGLLQEGFTRDTERFALKASYGEREDGTGFNIQKKPKTDASKTSKAGKFKVILEEGSLKTVSIDDEGENILRTIYEDGSYYPDDFENIIRRAEAACFDEE
ncbi:nicotinate phosphoribosyltransferase [Floricoccus penangensis]|uniref:nicotinate phosphoribosyltransferase n=1 Tax=Floricoccus penangensis TaxID=1859475 RepID=UPI00203BAAF0|nr:nicotinate phosphoribosyltransferase [Floricoccus penangensis]URZ88007.1 nicotinate phosphoribosyltransferase [Floricoccus penangensis]